MLAYSDVHEELKDDTAWTQSKDMILEAATRKRLQNVTTGHVTNADILSVVSYVKTACQCYQQELQDLNISVPLEAPRWPKNPASDSCSMSRALDKVLKLQSREQYGERDKAWAFSLIQNACLSADASTGVKCTLPNAVAKKIEFLTGVPVMTLKRWKGRVVQESATNFIESSMLARRGTVNLSDLAERLVSKDGFICTNQYDIDELRECIRSAVKNIEQSLKKADSKGVLPAATENVLAMSAILQVSTGQAVTQSKLKLPQNARRAATLLAQSASEADAKKLKAYAANQNRQNDVQLAERILKRVAKRRPDLNLLENYTFRRSTPTDVSRLTADNPKAIQNWLQHVNTVLLTDALLGRMGCTTKSIAVQFCLQSFKF